MGPFRNPQTMEPSDSFILSTYVASNSNTRYLYYNQEDEGLTIQNTQQGTISNFLVVQNSSDLSSPSQLNRAEYLFSFSSQTAITQTIQILIKIPTILILEDRKFLVSVNGKNVTSSYLSASRQLRVRVPQPPADLKYILSIIDGLRSPMAGPYTVSGFMIEIQSEQGYAIDSLPSQGYNITTECSQKCASCSWSLSNCTSCSDPLYLSNNRCEEECQKGAYADEAAQKCLPCKTPCQECKFSATQCTRCLPGNSFGPSATPDTTLECLKECPLGTYLDKAQGLCLSCRSPCYTCNGTASLCLSCQSGYKWVERELKCYKECPVGTIAIQSSPQCVECSPKCKSCSESPDQCSSCSLGQYLFKNQECLDACPAQYQANDATLECDYFGEEVFPVPFSVFSGLLISVIFVAWRFNRDTSASEVSLACLDVTSKLNQIFLLAHYFTHSYYLPGSLISVSLVLSIVTNLFLFRPSLMSRTLTLPFRPPLSGLILYLSVTLSFHLYRTLQSRLLALKGLSHPAMSEGMRGVMYRVSVIAVVTQIPLVLAGMILVIVRADSAKLDTQRFTIDGLIVTSALLLNIGYVVLRLDKPQSFKAAIKDLMLDVAYAVRGRAGVNDGVPTHKKSGGLFGRAQVVQEEQREVEKLEWSVGDVVQKKLDRRESLLASPMVIQSLMNNNMTPQRLQRVRKSLKVNNPVQFNERLLRTLNSTGEKVSPRLSTGVTRNFPLMNHVASQESLVEGGKRSDGKLIRHFPSVPRRSTMNAQILVQESLGSLGEDGEHQTEEGQLQTFDVVVAKAMSTLQQTDRPITNWDYFNVQAMITQLHKLSLSTKSSIRDEQARKNLIKQHLADAKAQSHDLLSEEVRLKKEIEDITKRLSEFKHITQLELQEGEQVKRAQSRERQRSRDFERQKMQPDPPPKKQLSTLKQPTLLQMVRESNIRRNSNNSKAKAKSIERAGGGGGKEEDSIEWINEALNGDNKGKIKKEKGIKDASPKRKKQKYQK